MLPLFKEDDERNSIVLKMTLMQSIDKKRECRYLLYGFLTHSLLSVLLFYRNNNNRRYRTRLIIRFQYNALHLLHNKTLN